jgi:hypothetical protein
MTILTPIGVEINLQEGQARELAPLLDKPRLGSGTFADLVIRFGSSNQDHWTLTAWSILDLVFVLVTAHVAKKSTVNQLT